MSKGKSMHREQGRGRLCCEGRTAVLRDARGPEGADCQQNGGETLKISAAAGVGSEAGAGGGRAARVQGRRSVQSGNERRVVGI